MVEGASQVARLCQALICLRIWGFARPSGRVPHVMMPGRNRWIRVKSLFTLNKQNNGDMERRTKKNPGVTNHLKVAKAAYAAEQIDADNVPVPWRMLFATGSFASSATGTGKVKQECDQRTRPVK